MAVSAMAGRASVLGLTAAELAEEPEHGNRPAPTAAVLAVILTAGWAV